MHVWTCLYLHTARSNSCSLRRCPWVSGSRQVFTRTPTRDCLCEEQRESSNLWHWNGHGCITRVCVTLANDRLDSVIFRGVRWGHRPLPQIFWPGCQKTPICCTGCRWWEASIQKRYVRTRCVNYTVKETIDCVNLHRCTDSRTRSMHVETLDRVLWCAERSASLVGHNKASHRHALLSETNFVQQCFEDNLLGVRIVVDSKTFLQNLSDIQRGQALASRALDGFLQNVLATTQFLFQLERVRLIKSLSVSFGANSYWHSARCGSTRFQCSPKTWLRTALYAPKKNACYL